MLALSGACAPWAVTSFLHLPLWCYSPGFASSAAFFMLVQLVLGPQRVRVAQRASRRLSNEGSRLLQGWKDFYLAKENPFLLLVWMNLGPGGARTHLYLRNMQLSQAEEDREPESLFYFCNKLQIPQADTMESIMKHTLLSPGLYRLGKERSTDSLSFLHFIQSSWGGFIYWILEV